MKKDRSNITIFLMAIFILSAGFLVIKPEYTGMVSAEIDIDSDDSMNVGWKFAGTLVLIFGIVSISLLIMEGIKSKNKKIIKKQSKKGK